MKMAAGMLLLAGATAVVPAGQPRPDFTGRWSIVRERSVWHDSAGDPVNVTVFGESFLVEQSREMLVVTIDNETGFRWIYRLDGTATLNTPPGPAGPQETASTAVWHGSTLAITTSSWPGRGGLQRRWTTARRLTMDADGTLRVEAPWGRDGAMIGSVYARVP